MTPIERAVQAVESALFNPALRASISIECDDPRRVHLAIVHAILFAIREPSDEMVKAGSGFSEAELGEIREDLREVAARDRENAVDSWQAMIDAALVD
jgi:ATP-dependent DNA ligase